MISLKKKNNQDFPVCQEQMLGTRDHRVLLEHSLESPSSSSFLSNNYNNHYSISIIIIIIINILLLLDIFMYCLL